MKIKQAEFVGVFVEMKTIIYYIPIPKQIGKAAFYLLRLGIGVKANLPSCFPIVKVATGIGNQF